MPKKPAKKTRKPASAPVKKLLHVGCGKADKNKLPSYFQGPEWQEIRLDIEPSVQPDILGDITDMQAVESASMDAVFSSHNVEHLDAHRVPDALREFHRVLKPGAPLIVTLPNIQPVAAAVALGRLEQPLYTSPAGPISALDILYGHGAALMRGQHYMAHRTAFTAETLAAKLRDAGFDPITVEKDTSFNLWARAVRPLEPSDPATARITIKGRSTYVAELPPVNPKSGISDDLDQPPLVWKPVTAKDASEASSGGF